MGIINTKLFFSDSMEYHALLFGIHALMDFVGLQAIVHKCVRACVHAEAMCLLDFARLARSRNSAKA
jgi:hypothetical protein